MLKKLLITLMMLCLLNCACAEELSVHVHDLSGMTLLTRSDTVVPADFLRLCPAADADAVRRIAPKYALLQYDLSAEVYALPDGTAWVMKGESVFRMTDPGCRVTSIQPVTLRLISTWQSDKGLLYTQQRGNETDVRCIDLRTGRIKTLLTAEGSLVLVSPSLNLIWTGYTPLPDFSDLLLCTAQIAQADAADPALTITLEKVVGDVTYEDDAYTASLRQHGHVTIEYGGERTASLEAFAAAYREMYPGHELGDPAESLCDRTYLTGDPAYGRLYEVTFSGDVFLWKDGQAHLINDSIDTPYYITGLAEAVLTDLNGDGTEEVVCIFDAGSGIFRHIAAVYDPASRKGLELYTSTLDGKGDLLHLQLEDGACQLYKGDSLLGTVINGGLDMHGFSLTNLMDWLGF